MKKQRLKKKIWLIGRQKRAIRRSKKKRFKNKSRGPYAEVRAGQILKLPPQLSLQGNPGIALMSIIRAMQERVIEEKKSVTLDCSGVIGVYPDGAIRLFAEIDRLTELSLLPKPIKIIAPINTRSRQIFKQLDFLSLTKDDLDIEIDRDDVIYWRCTAGLNQSGDVQGEFLMRVTNKANEVSSIPVVVEKIWPGISEAIINTTEHAYIENTAKNLHPAGNRWWLLTSLREDNFSAAVCDLGVGYRNTVNRTIPEKIINRMRSLLQAGNTDTDALQLAMEYGRTRTGKEERGKGSRDALSILTKHGQGELAITSKKGLIRFEYDTDNKPKPKISKLKADIDATIVWWSLPLSELE